MTTTLTMTTQQSKIEDGGAYLSLIIQESERWAKTINQQSTNEDEEMMKTTMALMDADED